LSLSTSNSYIRNGRTGVNRLDLPLVTVGGSTPDITKRPKVGEDNVTTGNVNLYNERLYTKASLRILLSDTSADIMNLPGIDTTKPAIQLEGDWIATPPYAGYTVGGNTALTGGTGQPPVARSLGSMTTTTTAATTTSSTSISVNAVPAVFQQSLTVKDAT